MTPHQQFNELLQKREDQQKNQTPTVVIDREIRRLVISQLVKQTSEQWESLLRLLFTTDLYELGSLYFEPNNWKEGKDPN